MPWRPSDAKKHTKKARTPALQKKWARIANAVLRSTGDEALAIKIANKEIAGGGRGKKKKAKR